MTIKKLKKLAEAKGVTVKECGNGHIQLIGKLMVNYYPSSRRRTAYVAQTNKGKNFVTPEEAINMCFEVPPITSITDRRKTRNRNGPHFRKLWNRQNGMCFVCHAPMKNQADKNDPLRATWEHLVPLARGGLDNFNNLALSHKKCNNDRGHNMPELETGCK